MTTLVDGGLPAGWKHRVTWSGLDAKGRRVASGVYLCVLVTDDAREVRKIVLVD